ncbi:MAG: hypothetical protein NVSMB2_10620 [Chloroflexota bacterium]
MSWPEVGFVTVRSMGGGRRAGLRVVVLVCVGTLGQACASSPGPSPTPSVTLAAPTVAVVTESPRPSLGSGADESGAIAAAISAASTHLGVRVADVSVVRSEPHAWSDAGLGCGEPGQMYAQVVTPGYAVIVRASGRELEYHTDGRGHAVLCAES